MNTPEPEPQWWSHFHPKNTSTLEVRNNAGLPANGITIEHNGKRWISGNNGRVELHLNGGMLKVNGIDITRRVHELRGTVWAQFSAIIRYSTQTGTYSVEKNDD